MAGMLVSAAVNAFAFSGAGFLFKLADKNGYAAEMKRHDLAQEKLQKTSTEWEEHRKQTIDFVNLQMKREHESSVDFQNVNASLTLYNELHPIEKVVLRKKPMLSDFYSPSKEMKNYEYLWIVAGIVGAGVLIKYLIK